MYFTEETNLCNIISTPFISGEGSPNLAMSCIVGSKVQF